MADVASTAIDLSPIANTLIEFAGALLAAFATWAVARITACVRKNLGLSIDEKTRNLLTEAIDNGIAYAQNKAKTEVAGLTVDVHNKTVAEAANYVAAHAPDALAHFGVTQDALVRKIIAQLPSDQLPVVPAPLTTA